MAFDGDMDVRVLLEDFCDFVEKRFALLENFCFVCSKEELFFEFDFFLCNDNVLAGRRAAVFLDKAFFERAFVGASAVGEVCEEVLFSNPGIADGIVVAVGIRAAAEFGETVNFFADIGAFACTLELFFEFGFGDPLIADAVAIGIGILAACISEFARLIGAGVYALAGERVGGISLSKERIKSLKKYMEPNKRTGTDGSGVFKEYLEELTRIQDSKFAP